MKQFSNCARWLGASALTLTLAAPLGAFAQDGPEEEEARQDVVVVTALKRETALQDTPLALTVLDGDALGTAGVESIVDLQNVAPSVQIGRSDFGVTINVRGVTTTDQTSKGDQGIAFNVDGVTIGRPREMGTAFFDIARVEVLRGPQGTLYGKSTTGGVINVITNRPENTFGGHLDLEYGDFDTKRIEGALNVPITDKFAVRGAVAFNERDGYLESDDGRQDFNDQDDLSFRLSGTYDFSDKTSLFVTTTFGEVQGAGTGVVPFANFIDPGQGLALGETLTVSSISGESARTVISVPDALLPSIDDEFINATAEFTTEFNGINLTYIAAHRNYNSNTFSVETLAPSPILGPPPPLFTWDWGQYRGTAITDQQELRISNANPGRLNWVAGYNWYREDLNESDHRWASPVTNPTREAGINVIDPVNSTDHESSGVFGQVDFAYTDSLNFTLGARYSEDEVERIGTFAVGPFQVDATGAPCMFPNDCIGPPNNGFQSDEKVTWRVGVDWKPIEDVLVYGSIATGYKAGGFNDFDPDTGTVGTYDPEELISYEVGYKGRLLENLYWDSALFFYDYSDAQISNLINIQGTPIIFTRIAGVEISGWENDFTWTPTDDDTLKFGFSLMDGEYTDFTAGGHAPGEFPPVGAEFVDWTGRPIDKVSDLTARIEYLRDWQLSNGGLVTLRVASRYDSGYYVSSVTDAIQVEQDGYTRSDANLTYVSPGQRYTIGAFVRNIEDELQLLREPQSGFPPGAGNTIGVSVTEPRVFGVRLGVEF